MRLLLFLALIPVLAACQPKPEPARVPTVESGCPADVSVADRHKYPACQ